MSTLQLPTSASTPVTATNSLRLMDHARMHRVLAVYDDAPEQSLVAGTSGRLTAQYGLTVNGGLTLGTALAITQGGTGATTVAQARLNLGLGTTDSPEFGGVNYDERIIYVLPDPSGSSSEVQINAAIQLIKNKVLNQANGGTVVLGAGTFFIHNPIIIDKANVKLQGGGGTRATRIVLASGSNCDMVQVTGSTTRGVYIKDIEFYGNYGVGNNTSGNIIKWVSSDASADADSKLENLFMIFAPEHGFLSTALNARGMHFRNVRVLYALKDGFNIASSDHSFIECNAVACHWSGFHINAWEAKFIGCRADINNQNRYVTGGLIGTADEVNGYGWWINGNYNQFNGCDSQFNYTHAVYIQNGTHNAFNGCKFEADGVDFGGGVTVAGDWAGIYLTSNASNTIINGCTFTGINTSVANWVANAVVVNGAQNTTITNNLINNMHKDAIVIKGEVKNLMIHSNNIRNCQASYSGINMTMPDNWNVALEQLDNTTSTAGEIVYRTLSSIEQPFTGTKCQWTTSGGVAVTQSVAAITTFKAASGSVPSLVQTKAVQVLNGNTGVFSFDVNPTATNLVVVAVFGRNAANMVFPTNAVTDNQGNTYTRSKHVSLGIRSCAIFYCGNVTASGTFTITIAPTTTSLNYFEAVAFEVAGMATTSVADSIDGNTGGASPSTQAATPLNTQADEFAVAVCSVNNSPATLTVVPRDVEAVFRNISIRNNHFIDDQTVKTMAYGIKVTGLGTSYTTITEMGNVFSGMTTADILNFPTGGVTNTVGSIAVKDEAYASGWNGSLQVPTKNAVYDKMETMASLSTTQTLTNKRLTYRVTTIVSSATPAINTDNCDAVTITALAADITSMTSSLTGTPVDFDRLLIRIKDNGTSRNITWGTSFEAKGVALPTATVISKVLTVEFLYDAVTAKWGCIRSVQEA